MTIYDDMRGYVHTHDRNGWFDVATETTPMYQMIDKAEAENAKLREERDYLLMNSNPTATELRRVRRAWKKDRDENAKLREQLEHLQPIDCEGNVLDIADKVNMLRSEYDGDHEWDDVVVELALAKWGGDRWIVRGSKGEAWACDCEKIGYDEDAYENSDDVEPIENPTLIEAENARLRELVRDMWRFTGAACKKYPRLFDPSAQGGQAVQLNQIDSFEQRMRELGIEVDG